MTCELAFVVYVIANLTVMYSVYRQIDKTIKSETSEDAIFSRHVSVHIAVRDRKIDLNDAKLLDTSTKILMGKLEILEFGAKMVKVINAIWLIMCTCLVAICGLVLSFGKGMSIFDLPYTFAYACIVVSVVCTLPFIIMIIAIRNKVESILKIERDHWDFTYL